MGHKHSTLHSQFRNQSDGPNCDLMMAGGSIRSSGHQSDGSNNNPTPYLNIKNGPFKRKLSVRNISIRRSFHMGKKSSKYHQQLNNDYSIQTPNNLKIGSSATTDQLPSTSSNASSGGGTNGGPSTSNHHHQNRSNHNHHHNHSNNHHQTPTPLPRSTSNRIRSNSSSHNSNSSGSEKFVMDRLRKSFRNSFRKKKQDIITESQKPHQWQSDEQAVRSGQCIFPVKYLGCVEVFESRGMQICEDALRRLRNSRRRGVKGQLYVTGDGIRVVDDDTKGLIVDQTIEKVSFCAPDRSHEHGFSYICRDGTTRRWMCHGFHATKDSGERLSHAVGCAFNICLERKQKRDKESVNAILDANNFQRTGSFRQSSITERLQDPQVAKPAEPIPVKPVHNPYAVARPHATASLLQRQGSLRGGPLNYASPFKRQLSLRLNSMTETKSNETTPTSPSTTTTTNDNILAELESIISPTSPSNHSNHHQHNQRNRAQSLDLAAFEDDIVVDVKNKNVDSNNYINLNDKNILTPSVASTTENKLTNGNDSSLIIAQMCQQLSQGLSMLTAKNTNDTDDSWSSSNGTAGTGGTHHFSPPAALTSTTTTTSTAANKTTINNNKMNNGTGLSHLVKDTNSLFSFSNIDQWISNTSTTSSNSQDKVTSSSSNTNNNMNKNLSQQLNTGSLDSGIASGCSISGKSTSTTVPMANSTTTTTMVPLIPPPIVDQMPQVDAPPPPPQPQSSSPLSFIHNNNQSSSTPSSQSPISSTFGHQPPILSSTTTIATTPPSTITITNTNSSVPISSLNNNNTHNPFLSYGGDDDDNTEDTEDTGGGSSSPPQSLPFKSTNPFLDLSQFDDSTNNVVESTAKFETFESIFDPTIITSTTETTETTTTTSSAAATTNNHQQQQPQQQPQQQMIKAFEVSM